jgi:PAS domain-containing protein
MLDDKGNSFGGMRRNTDTEDLNRAEEKRQSEGDLRVIIDTIPTMAWSALPDGSVDFLNNRWIEFCGLSLGEPLVRPSANRHTAPEGTLGLLGGVE